MKPKIKRKPKTGRWAHTTKAERADFARMLRRAPGSGAGAGRKPLPDRCPCGKYSVHLAAKRRHVCTARPAALD
jgi:hypothetical protein